MTPRPGLPANVLAIFGAVAAAERIRRERQRLLDECVTRRMTDGMDEEEAKAACRRELGLE